MKVRDFEILKIYREGETDPKHCVIKNPGSGVATQIIKCVIQAFDSFGNVCTNGDDNFVITAVKDDYSVTGSVKYVDYGTYECCIQPGNLILFIEFISRVEWKVFCKYHSQRGTYSK